MKYLDLTFTTPAENLACDEALLDFCEATSGPNILRLWEPMNYFVVVGYANKVEQEVNVMACAGKNVPILRRCSGGGTVVQGPGSFNYSLILRFADESSLETITRANQFIMEKNRTILTRFLGTEVAVRGHTDLVIGERKFSGNAQRRRKNYLLFHGTFLVNFKLELIENLLRMPSKEPCYRENRTHLDFLMNMECRTDQLKGVLQEGWNADEPLVDVPDFAGLVQEKYSRDEWNLKF